MKTSEIPLTIYKQTLKRLQARSEGIQFDPENIQYGPERLLPTHNDMGYVPWV